MRQRCDFLHPLPFPFLLRFYFTCSFSFSAVAFRHFVAVLFSFSLLLASSPASADLEPCVHSGTYGATVRMSCHMRPIERQHNPLFFSQREQLPSSFVTISFAFLFVSPQSRAHSFCRCRCRSKRFRRRKEANTLLTHPMLSSGIAFRHHCFTLLVTISPTALFKYFIAD